jgi:hypothetical protein
MEAKHQPKIDVRRLDRSRPTSTSKPKRLDVWLGDPFVPHCVRTFDLSHLALSHADLPAPSDWLRFAAAASGACTR